MSEALKALGVKDKHTRSAEQFPVIVNTLPWPRSAIVPVSEDKSICAQNTNERKYAAVKAGALATDVIESVNEQMSALCHGKATSTPCSYCRANSSH